MGAVQSEIFAGGFNMVYSGGVGVVHITLPNNGRADRENDQSPLVITLADGSTHEVSESLTIIIDGSRVTSVRPAVSVTGPVASVRASGQLDLTIGSTRMVDKITISGQGDSTVHAPEVGSVHRSGQGDLTVHGNVGPIRKSGQGDVIHKRGGVI